VSVDDTNKDICYLPFRLRLKRWELDLVRKFWIRSNGTRGSRNIVNKRRHFEPKKFSYFLLSRISLPDLFRPFVLYNQFTFQKPVLIFCFKVSGHWYQCCLHYQCSHRYQCSHNH
jgi:hypothetical protein